MIEPINIFWEYSQLVGANRKLKWMLSKYIEAMNESILSLRRCYDYIRGRSGEILSFIQYEASWYSNKISDVNLNRIWVNANRIMLVRTDQRTTITEALVITWIIACYRNWSDIIIGRLLGYRTQELNDMIDIMALYETSNGWSS